MTAKTTKAAADAKTPISAQAALAETLAMNQFLSHRNLLLSQQVHELGATVEALRAELAVKKGKA